MYEGPGMHQAPGYLLPGGLKPPCQQDMQLQWQGKCYLIPILQVRKPKLMNLKDLSKAIL